MSLNLREIHITDAEAFLRLLTRIEQESPFALLEPGERRTSIREQQEEIDQILSHPNQMMWVVEDRDQLVGWLGAYGADYRRTSHSVLIGVGVLSDYQRQGIATWLFQTLEDWAWKNAVRRLELYVANENQAGIQLYRKMGFQIEGTKRESYKVNGKFLDEYLMSKILAKPEPPKKNLYPRW